MNIAFQNNQKDLADDKAVRPVSAVEFNVTLCTDLTASKYYQLSITVYS